MRERIDASRRWQSDPKNATPAQLQKRRLAEAMRVVIERLVTSDAPEEELRAVAKRLEDYASHLATHPKRTRLIGFAEASNAGSVTSFFDSSPLIGMANPLAPPIELRVEGDEVVGRVQFGHAYEGPPQHVHGGYVAATFDEVLGFAQSMTGHPGMTGTLTVRYRRPTPLNRELRLSGRVHHVEGRKIFAKGELFAGDDLCAEAEGIFISVDPERFRGMAGNSPSS